jgi:wyosine [tRNA(Phe)-imidazoG37] synthetase (radical SAM superfamily)
LIYGPLASRRLGSSLGINLLGSGDKLCSFNCRYCQCGWTRCPTLDVAGRTAGLPSADQVARALEQTLQRLAREGVSLGAITFSGNGEPTLHPELADIVEATAALRDRYAPGTKLAILSNSSTVHRPEVRAALAPVDLKIMKLDAGSEVLMRRINLPARGFDYERMLRGLAELEGVVLQSMFICGAVDNTDPPQVREWIRRVSDINPQRVQMYSFDRSAPDRRLRPVPMTVLTAIASYARWRTGVAFDVV